MGKDYQYINPATVRETTYSLYARDRWQATRKLTISYGVRWELYPFATRDHFGGARYDPATNLAYLGGVNGGTQRYRHECGPRATGPRGSASLTG